MNDRRIAVWCAFALPFMSFGAGLPDKVDFNYHIRPLLSDRCFACHGPDERARKAELRLDREESALRAIEGGKFVIKRGDPAKSELISRLTHSDPAEKMPPPESNLSVSRDEIALIRRWIEQGAEWKQHWAFIPVRAVNPPPLTQQSWPRNEIDYFVLARLEQEGLRPSPEATKERLIRRATLDVTGLPPGIAEIDAFLADNSPQAYERVVDRLLASPSRGERMATDWLDVARYADTYGYQADRFNHLWPWRDWVISAFNANLPFDEFIIWQIAGDLLPGATHEQRLATAFNRLHRQTNEGGSVNEEFRVEYVADRVHTMAGAFLGLTMECARCHDHKYDPISQKDYYRLFAFFNSTEESGLYSHFTDAIPSPTLLLFENEAQEREHIERKRAIRERERMLIGYRDRAKAGFAEWLESAPPLPPVAGLIAHYSFDEITRNEAPNLVGTNYPGKLLDNPQAVPGKAGQALLFDGENAMSIDKLGTFRRSDPFSFSLWLNIPEEDDEIVVLHHQQAGSDAGYHGYQLVLEAGKVSFALVHFWPGNAIKVITHDKLPLREWVQVGVTYDGSSRSSGLKLHVNGRLVPVAVIKDNLFKDFRNDVPLKLAARFRGRGFKEGRVDELKVFDRMLTAIEMARVCNGEAVSPARDPGDPELFDYYLANFDEGFAAEMARLKKLRDQENDLINRIREIMIMGDLPVARPTYVLKRGSYDARGEEVQPGPPENISGMWDDRAPTRLGLAQWLVSPMNPLTARVIVNRYWQMFFGRGLVETAEDFGSQGALPSHPELLDWMAKHFVESGWDLKALQRLILISATYRQSSRASPELLVLDPENDLLARGPKNRLTAEMLRDHALASAGLLVQKIGGPSVKPYQPEGLWEEKSTAWKYKPDKGAGLYRRSLYTYWKRSAPHPMMTTFDAAERNVCTARRQTTSTPLQALVLLNDAQFIEAARKLAERTLREGASEVHDRITFMFRRLTGRHPTDAEQEVLQRLYKEQLLLFRKDSQSAHLLQTVGESQADVSLDGAEVAAMTALANAIMNFDEAVMKR